MESLTTKDKAKLSVILYCVISISQAFAFIDDIAIGVGTQTQFVGKIQTNEVGDTNKFDFNPYLTLGAEIPVINNFSFLPEAGILLPDSTRDSEISKVTFFVVGTIGYAVQDWVIRFGMGLQMTSISGDGGTQNLPNGSDPNGTSFPMPKERATSRNVITNIGTEYFFHSDWSARIDSTIYNPTNSRNRAFGYQLAVHYHFHDLFASKQEIQTQTPKEDSWEKQ